MLTPEEMNAHDKRRAANHEAGHAVTAWLLGSIVLGVRILPTDSKDLQKERAWVGSCTHSQHSEAAVIAWAGGVAEEILFSARNGVEPYFEDFEAMEELQTISPTDKAAIDGGESWHEDRDRAISIITEHQALVSAIAESLIEDEVIDLLIFDSIMRDLHLNCEWCQKQGLKPYPLLSTMAGER